MESLTPMSLFIRIALLLLLVTVQVMGAPSFGAPPEGGAAESSLGFDGADDNDTEDDFVIAAWTHEQVVHHQGSSPAHDVDAPEGPPLPPAERPPNA